MLNNCVKIDLRASLSATKLDFFMAVSMCGGDYLLGKKINRNWWKMMLFPSWRNTHLMKVRSTNCKRIKWSVYVYTKVLFLLLLLLVVYKQYINGRQQYQRIPDLCGCWWSIVIFFFSFFHLLFARFFHRRIKLKKKPFWCPCTFSFKT